VVPPDSTDAASGPVDAIAECGIAVGMLHRKRRHLDPVALENHAIFHDAGLDAER